MKTKPVRIRARRSLFSRLILGLGSAAFLGALVAAGIFLYGKYIYESPGPLAHATLVTVERGSGIRAIAENLEAQGVIADARVFMGAVLMTENAARLKAGDYRFPARVSMREVLDDLVTGKALVYKLTIPEGWTSQQVVERVRAHEALVGEITSVPAEGTLLPETYIFERGRTRQSVLDEMMAAQQRVLDELWETRAENLPVKTREEAVILASIVEKETGVAEERPRVAAVFSNRLMKGMRLQSDPTIIYGLVGGAGSLGRPLTRADIASKTEHNTYVINGLPPTPIANPGRAAIAAVLNPAQSSDLYFVADGTGGHAFAQTLEQHQANVRKWRQIERQRRQQETVRAAAVQPESVPSSEAASAENRDAVQEPSSTDASAPAAPGDPSSAAGEAGRPALETPALPDAAEGEPPMPTGLPSGAPEPTASARLNQQPAPETASENASPQRASRVAPADVPIPVAKPPVPRQ